MKKASPDDRKTMTGKIHSLRLSLPRKSIDEALIDAALGKPPQNPHHSPEGLREEALIANAIFDQYIRPALRIAIGCPHYTKGPVKDTARALAKKGLAGLNCDWARHSNLLNNMGMAQLASDMLHQRGVLTLKSPEGLPINLYIVDTDNTFLKDDPKKPGLRMINTKFLIPIPLKDGESTYHILELRSYLAASEKTYQKSELAYKEFRDAHNLSREFERFSMNSSYNLDKQTQKKLQLGWAQAQKTEKSAWDTRTTLNTQDADRNGANALLGYTPKSCPTGKSWSFMTFENYALKQSQNAISSISAPELKQA